MSGTVREAYPDRGRYTYDIAYTLKSATVVKMREGLSPALEAVAKQRRTCQQGQSEPEITRGSGTLRAYHDEGRISLEIGGEDLAALPFPK